MVGISNSPTGAGSAGWSPANSTGLMGYSNDSLDSLPAAIAKTGVFGYAAQDSTSLGVFGQSPAGTGTRGSSTSGSGVTGNSSTGYGVAGNSSHSYGVYGGSATGTGVFGIGYANTGVQGYSGAFGTQPAAPAKTGVFGYAGQTGGRGGQFGGRAAQIRLVPSTAISHPTSGALGDLFLDKNKRLWFCKGGTAWKQLA